MFTSFGTKGFIVKMSVMVVVLLVIYVSAIILADKDRMWVMLNSSDAELYAQNLLKYSHGLNKTPDKFIDYVVITSKNDGSVTFSAHNDHSTIYGYFSNKLPWETSDLEPKEGWELLDGKWFVFHFK